jgi:hypothetical protein
MLSGTPRIDGLDSLIPSRLHYAAHGSGFHQARSIDRRGRLYAEPEVSELMLESYPDAMRGWISSRDGLTLRLLLLRGRELAGIYPVCL